MSRLHTQHAADWNVARAQTDQLFSLLDPAALYDRPVDERHRLIFYLGHVEAFDWNLLHERALGKASFHPTFDKLFAFGIDPEPGRAPADRPADWPREEEVRAYIARVRSELDSALDRVPEQLLHVAVEHRLMHAETLAYLFHNLPYEKKLGPPPPGSVSNVVENAFVEIPAGPATLGRPRNDGFGWDNEFDLHTADVPAFRISRFKISNGEYLEDVRSGVADAPHFWVERSGRYFLRAMFGELPLPLDWPVYVTHSEASAYALRRNVALPTEAQFHRASHGSPQAATAVNAGFERWDPVSVTDRAAPGVAQLVGNGWEWTSTVFAPFAGFEPFPFYPGYSADFFDAKHFVMKGASPRTAPCFLRSSFRNWFRPDYPHVYAGFRLVQNR
jgi:gamma-glutamyl hercynylcysteine S-oxide synthase